MLNRQGAKFAKAGTFLRRRFLLTLGVLCALAVGPSVADTALPPGTTLSAVTFEDQHGAKHTIDESVRLIVFAVDMDAGGIAKEALAQDGAKLLAGAGAIYVADISKMPAMIAKMFAVPAMRRRGYPVLLDRDGSLTREWPRVEGQLTMIGLDRLTVSSVSQVTSVADLRQQLEAKRP